MDPEIVRWLKFHLIHVYFPVFVNHLLTKVSGFASDVHKKVKCFLSQKLFGWNFPNLNVAIKIQCFPPHLHQLCLCVSLHLAAKVFVFSGLWADGWKQARWRADVLEQQEEPQDGCQREQKTEDLLYLMLHCHERWKDGCFSSYLEEPFKPVTHEWGCKKKQKNSEDFLKPIIPNHQHLQDFGF